MSRHTQALSQNMQAQYAMRKQTFIECNVQKQNDFVDDFIRRVFPFAPYMGWCGAARCGSSNSVSGPKITFSDAQIPFLFAKKKKRHETQLLCK